MYLPRLDTLIYSKNLMTDATDNVQNTMTNNFFATPDFSEPNVKLACYVGIEKNAMSTF